MKRLDGLLVVTGTIHVEGGEKSQARKTEVQNTRNLDRVTTVHTRTISKDRRAAMSKKISYSRRFGRLALLKTPYGLLVDPDKKFALLALLMQASQDVAKFNASAEGCVLTNCIVWEPLVGNRFAAVEGWLTRYAKIDKAVRDFLHT